MINDQSSLYTVLAISSLALAQYYWFGGRKLRHPPSPRPLPLVGNIFSIPPGLDYMIYTELGRQLNSDIVYLNMMGQPVIVLNSTQAASDLFEKRSAYHSDRPSTSMLSDPTLLDWPGFIGLLPYSDLWRRQRRRLNEWLNIRAVRQYEGLQRDEARLLLGRLLEIPSGTQLFAKVKELLFFTMGSTTFKLAYGYRFKDNQDPFFLNAIESTEILFQATKPGNFLVNVFPALSYIPEWFPGAGWKATARKWRKQKNDAVDAPYEWTKRQVATGHFQPSVLSASLQSPELDAELSDEDREKELKELAFVLFIAGMETTATALVNFIAAMIVNPEAQAKAQAELDSVLGYANRLPTASDESQLPYVRNLILEVLRWQPVGPTGGPPHVCYQDDIYRGYEIRKGTVFLGNIWAMSRDEAAYKSPESFDPDRFLDPNVPVLPGFGWGRRKCPGIHFAEMSLFLTISSLLTAFSFSRKKGEDGEEIIPTIEAAGNNFVLSLKPFDFDLRLRSERHRQLILENVPSE